MEIVNYLGVDYGRAKVGLAIANSETKIAFAFLTLKNDKNFLEKLVAIIDAGKISTIVIGIPSYAKREKIEYDGEKLAKLIKKMIDVEIVFQDEMFTTKMAGDNLREKGMKKVESKDDAEAAKIILQSWLDCANRL